MFCLFPFFAFHTPGGASAPGGHFFAWKAKFLPVLPVPPFFLYSCPAHVAGGLATTSFFTSQLPCPLSLPTPPLSLSLSLSPRAPAPTRRCSEHSVRPTPWPVRMRLTTSFSSPWRAWNYHARLWSVFFFFATAGTPLPLPTATHPRALVRSSHPDMLYVVSPQSMSREWLVPASFPQDAVAATLVRV